LVRSPGRTHTGPVNEALLYLSRHNTWASKTLLGGCRTLTSDQLTAPATAAFGNVIDTFNHLVTSEGGYLSALGGPLTTWVEDAKRELEKYPDYWDNGDACVPVVILDELALRIDELGQLWESFFANNEFGPEEKRVLDSGTYECPAGIVMAQLFHHGGLHREQICATLSGLGLDPPDLQPWEFADSTGISRFLGGRTS